MLDYHKLLQQHLQKKDEISVILMVVGSSKTASVIRTILSQKKLI